jgi:hypothetical protein
MVDLSEPLRAERTKINAPNIGVKNWTRVVTGSLGALFCAAGAAVAVFSFPDLPLELWLGKVALGVLVFAAGLMMARAGSRAPASELHFDPEYGEFILVGADQGLEDAQCVMSTDMAKIDVSGRHLSVETLDERLKISVALKDAETARDISETCQVHAKAA